MILLATVFAMIASVAGLLLSYHAEPALPPARPSSSPPARFISAR